MRASIHPCRSQRPRRFPTPRGALRLGLVVAGLALAGGCTHARTLPPTSRIEPEQVARVNHELRNRDVRVTLRDGPPLVVREARLTGDSLAWAVPDALAPRAASLENVYELSFRSARRGALDGLLIGLLVGAPAGALLIDSPDGRTGLGDRLQAALAGGASFGLWSALIGAYVGGRMVYVLQPPSERKE